jgi:hypothetical protein
MPEPEAAALASIERRGFARKAVRAAAWVAALALLGVGTLDAAAWLLLPPPMPFNPNAHYVEETPYLSHSPRFGIATNNHGFRNASDFELPLRDGRPRLLLIGDSFVFGGPNDRTLDAFLSEALPTCHVLNGGSPGADPAFYAEMVEYYAPRLRPEHLVIGLFLGNDFAGPLAEQRATACFRLRQLAKTLFAPPIRLVKRLAVQRGRREGGLASSALTRPALRERAAAGVASLCEGLCLDSRAPLRRLETLDLDRLLDSYPGLQTVEGAAVLANAVVYRDHLSQSLLLGDENARRGYDDSLQRVASIRDLVATSSLETLFVLFPVSFMLEARYAAFYRELGYVVPEAAARYPLVDRVRSDLAAAGLQVLDLHGALAGQDAFFAEDWHLNETGNRLAAAAIAARIQGASARGAAR